MRHVHRTQDQLFALLSASIALGCATQCVLAIRSPRGILRTQHVVLADLMAFVAVWIGVLAVAEARFDASLYCRPACVYHAPAWLALMMTALLVLSLCALGYAVVKRPRNPHPTA